MLETQAISDLDSVVPPLPALPEGEVYTPEQWTMLLAICDTYIPSIRPSTGTPTGADSDPQISALPVPDAEFSAAKTSLMPYLPESEDAETITAYLNESVVSHPEFRALAHRRLRCYAPASGLNGLGLIFSALNTRLGSFLLTGSTTPFHLQPLQTRTAVVQSWALSSLRPLRAFHNSMSALAKQTWLFVSPTLPSLSGFPNTPKHIERRDGYPFTFHQFDAGDAPAALSTDVVVVGSGCGAGVCAYNLASAGHRVLVIEKSYHYSTNHFPMSTFAAGIHLMENGGSTLSDDGSIAVLAGSTWGGGGTVNWSASLQPQHFVREEWSRAGLPVFTSTKFQDCLDTVCERMGVCRITDNAGKAKIEHNFPNCILLEGGRRLGYAVESVPQNTGGKQHWCGHCTLGCSAAVKMGPANRWLPDAAEKGAEFIEGCWVEEVLFDETEKSSKEKKAVGVRGQWTSRDGKTTRQIVVTAKTVIVASGALQSPLVLMRSGITNPQLGKNLHLHPVTCIGAVWDQPARSWEGPILTTAVTSLENLDGLHHGPKLEVLASTPGFLLLSIPWRANVENPALDFKVQLAKFRNMTGNISLQRDRDSGRVYMDPVDPRRVRIAYTCSTRDWEGILAGVIATARILFVMGAREIFSLHPEAERFVRSDNTKQRGKEDDEWRFEAWLDESVRALGPPPMLGSAHQMGTCRMGPDARSSVVDSHGRVWGTQGLYVADSSVFPSASGVNPMVTTMGIAELISRGIVAEQ